MKEAHKLSSASDVRQAAIDAHHKGDVKSAENLYRIYL